MGLVAVVVVLCGAPSVRSQGVREVVFLGFGGTHEKNMKERVLPPFERTHNARVVYVTGTMAANFARARRRRVGPTPT